MTELVVGIALTGMIIGSLIAIETPDFLSSVISMSVAGLFSSLCFLMVGAPEIAMIQMVVEALSLIILIRATIRKDVYTITGDREFFGLMATLATLFVVFIFLFRTLQYFPAFGSSVVDRIPESASAHYLRDGFTDTGTGNLVGAILLDYRAYDVLGQVTVLFAASLGALAILRKTSRRKKTPDGQK